jgi:molybdenum cofactor biosynthesis enzyme
VYLLQQEVKMTSEQIEICNELAQVAIDAELRMGQAAMSIKAGNINHAKTHIEQAHRVCQRLLNELGELSGTHYPIS